MLKSLESSIGFTTFPLISVESEMEDKVSDVAVTPSRSRCTFAHRPLACLRCSLLLV